MDSQLSFDAAPTLARFQAKVRVIPDTGCWIWTGAVTKSTGYGKVKLNGKAVDAHRAFYVAYVGPVPAGLELDHTCHNADTTCPGGPGCRHRACVYPGHLEAVTKKLNAQRGRNGQNMRSRTHCPHGHSYDLLNTLWERGRTERRCRECTNRQERLRRIRRREKVAAVGA